MNDSCEYLLKAGFGDNFVIICNEIRFFNAVGGGFSGAHGGDTQKQESKSEVSELKR